MANTWVGIVTEKLRLSIPVTEKKYIPNDAQGWTFALHPCLFSIFLFDAYKQSSEEESEVENIVTAPKTDMFRFRINPEIRKQVEEVYAKNGLTFTEIKTNSLHRRRFKICLAINKEDAPGSAEIAPQ